MLVRLKRWMSYVLSLGTKHQVPIPTRGLLLTAPRMAMAATGSHKIVPKCHPTTLCAIFFFPLGIIPLVYSIQVSTHYDRGNYAEAESASRKSLLWARGLTIAAAVCVGISIAIFVAIAIAATSAVSAAL